VGGCPAVGREAGPLDAIGEIAENLPGSTTEEVGSILKAGDVEELRQTVDRLRAEVDELRASGMRLVRHADADRRAIERDLHHGLQQYLVGAATGLALARGVVDADPGSLGPRLEEIARDVRRALDEAGRLAHRIYPPLLETGGLAAALRAAAATLGVTVRIRAPEKGAYPPEVAGAVYFCWLDLLERTPTAAEAAITLRDEGGLLAFEIETKGGAVRAAVPDVLQDRVEALGGTLTIHSGSDDGTRLSGSLPLRR
jgi:signal transduction histidine kinase